MILSWWKRRRRANLLATPFPNPWRDILQRKVWPYSVFPAEDQQRLRNCVQVFVAEKNWEGCNGLVLTDEIRVTIAGYACLLLLGLDHDYFSNVLSVLVYPADYRAPVKSNHLGVVVEGEDGRHGEAWYRGPVILSWSEIEEDITHAGDGENLILHEFAHQLDMLNRVVDGTPPLHSRHQAERWHRVMTAEFKRLIRDSRHGRPTLIDAYGAMNEAEFFAVATECFFDAGAELRAEHPELYDLLSEYYGQDPAAWRQPLRPREVG